MNFEKLSKQDIDMSAEYELADRFERENEREVREMFKSHVDVEDEVQFNEIDKQNFLKAKKFVENLVEIGVNIDEKSYTRMIEIFSSNEALHVDRKEFAELVEYDVENKELMKNFSTIIEEQFYELLKMHLVQESQEIFQDNQVSVVRNLGVKLDGVTMNIDDLNDKEIVDLGDEKITEIVHDIINDDIEAAGQGMFWNVFIAKDSEYVLKIQKYNDKWRRKYNKDSVARYAIIRDVVGNDFLPKQALIQTSKSEQVHILQEKADLSKMKVVRFYEVDKLINGEYAKEIKDALKKSENKQILEKFISGCEELYEKHGLIVDLIGNNFFAGVSEEGLLDIKLVDYGVFKESLMNEDKNIQNSLDTIRKLKELLK